MLAMHLSNSAEWFTPDVILERAQRVLGHIDLDPASCEAANMRVGARTFFTAEQDGLAQDWDRYAGTVFLNPPGDKRGKLPKAFWEKFMTMKDMSQGIYVGFSLEQLRYLPDLGSMLNTVVIPRKRISYLGPDGKVKNSPPHGSFIVHRSPGSLHFRDNFCREFRDIANVIFT